MSRREIEDELGRNQEEESNQKSEIMEAGFSGKVVLYQQGWEKNKRLFYEAWQREPRHFLEACFLCKKPLLGHNDIFMYRDYGYCSEGCRQEIIEADEALEKKRSVSMRVSSSSKPDSSKPATKEGNGHNCHLRPGTVVAG